MAERSTQEELAERVAYAAGLKLQSVAPRVILSRLVQSYGVSLRQARRYLALATEEVRTDGIEPPDDPFAETATMALQRIQHQMLDATPSELPRLVAALAKLREVMPAAPTLSQAELINRAAFSGGLAKREPPPPLQD
jgi:hypothetical protein